MKQEVLNALLLAGMFLTLFAMGELLYHKFRVKAEYTRKIVHIGTGFLTLLFPVLLGNHWFVLALCASFALILIISLRTGMLKSINNIGRESAGSISYPISVYLCYLAFDYSGQEYLYFYLPVLVLAICDPIAALCGRRWPFRPYKIGSETKSFMGSAMFFASAALLGIILISLLNPEKSMLYLITTSLIIALFSAVTEGLSTKGFDNLTIPPSVLLGIFLTNQFF